MEKKRPKISLKEGIAVLIVLLAIMAAGIIGLKISPEVPILMGIMLLIFWAKLRGFSWDDIHESFMIGIKNGIVPLFIFLLIGSLIGVWIATGIIPSLMVFGFKLISIRWFLPSVFVVCALVGSIIGSAFTIISTLGIAFMGIGLTMGINPAMVAGAVLSGAVFGDKSSPLSATNNLSAAVADADLITHIKNIMWSTLPASIVAFILYAFMSHGDGHANLDRIQGTVMTLHDNFTISAWAAVPVLLLFICSWSKIPTIPTLFINIVVSSIIGLIQNPQLNLVKLNNVIQSGYVAHTRNPQVDVLLTRGGIAGMMGTMSLIFVALALGGILMHLGIVDAVIKPLTDKLKTDGNLITTVIATCIGVNIFIGEQYLSIILPANAFKKTFAENNLAPVALSRALEDGGTVINYLIPWGVAGAFATNALGVPTIHYLPFVFVSLLSPVFSIISAYTGIGIKHLKPVQK
ncbi:Na+/H+ antiporter NhaC [Lactobacillus sp. Sy-1]|uniref:Na+/H+ antiporter NhaC n=1 Tax=Lactobacillus sp. Sy-1 TaxID=2109645 RepID=UPI001C575F52|nr:Na+/H+ antiporter NhaC [Lactobacillus sp. Sy-1]MBW1604877.1 Na+/H+ antiporter NhaC [Lactobacillus sp. Sy-1]